MLVFVAIARLCEVDWSTIGERSWFSYEYHDGMSIILEGAAPVQRVLPDGTEEWRDGGKGVCQIYPKDYESIGMMKKFAEAAWLWYIDYGEDYYELPLLEVQEELLNPRRSPAH